MLLGGRAGDLFGRRRVFASGLAIAGSQWMLVAARALQGIGGATPG
ncbi:MAG TPA: hypothetical protein VK869_05345 [Rubrobacteraceae bacterium]|nr:hypothetical protein [Rubrobacteraceae bacterium]